MEGYKYQIGAIVECPECTNTKAEVKTASKNVAAIDCSMCARTRIVKNERFQVDYQVHNLD